VRRRYLGAALLAVAVLFGLLALALAFTIFGIVAAALAVVCATVGALLLTQDSRL
jgi:hypothetical protein